jgi:dienelactone hydrolase
MQFLERNMRTRSRLIDIPVEREEIQGELLIPEKSASLVVFALGSGSSRHSPRNQHVADVLNEAGISTLLIDLLSEAEQLLDAQTSQFRWDVELLAQRLSIVTHWLKGQSVTDRLHIGYFAAGVGAAAALIAAGKDPGIVEAVASRGGRPDLAGAWLMKVRAPVLLIVGGNDRVVIELNTQAAADLRTEHRLEIVPNAGSLFEEAAALDSVAALAKDWFEDRLIFANRRAA